MSGQLALPLLARVAAALLERAFILPSDGDEAIAERGCRTRCFLCGALSHAKLDAAALSGHSGCARAEAGLTNQRE